MYESESEHFYPIMKYCPVCKSELKEWYRKKERMVKTLQGNRYLVSHVYKCKMEGCGVKIEPENEGKIVLKHCRYGLDVLLKIGELRYKKNKTCNEVREDLLINHQVVISERDIGNQERTYMTLVKMLGDKEDSTRWKNIKKQKGVVLAIDGIKPDSGDDILFLIRDLQSGYVLAAKMLEYTSKNELANLIQQVKEMPFRILGVVSDNESLVVAAIKEKLPDIPYQLCQYHFYKQLAKKIKSNEGKLKKK